MSDKRDWTIKTETITSIIAWTSGLLVLFLAVGGFALSYQALRELSAANGLSDWRAYVWPLLIDAAIVVFSLAVLGTRVLRTDSRWAWSLVIVFTVGTIVFNLVHAGGNVWTVELFGIRIGLKYLVGIVPPLAFVLAFETLMGMVRSGVERKGLVDSLVSLRQELASLKLESQTEIDKRELELSRIETKRLDIVAKLNGQIEAKKQELKELERQPQLSSIISKEDRQSGVSGLVSEGLEVPQIAARFGVSVKTIQRDLKELGIETNGNH